MTRPHGFPSAKWFAQRRNVRGHQRTTTTRTLDELCSRFARALAFIADHADQPAAFASFRRKP